MHLPLFPLNTVLCPGIALPLHVFEDRYRALVRYCLETTSPFGVVLIREGREVGTRPISFSDTGTIAEIRDAGRLEDGRFDLLVVGTRRFRIRSILEGRGPYLVADAEVLEETVDDPARAQELANRATRRFVSYLELLRPRSGETSEEIDVRIEVETEPDDDDQDDDDQDDDDHDDDDHDDDDHDDDEEEADEMLAGAGEDAPSTGGPEVVRGERPRRRRVLIPDDPTVLSHLLAGILQIELPRRQALLEIRSTEERLVALLKLIDREIFLLGRRLRAFTPDSRVAGPRRS
jgi:Lon protease-like protein